MLDNKIALVTGASRGFGFASARAMAAAGAHVVAVARTVGGLEELDDLIKAEGGSATLVPLDITDDGGLARMGAALYERFGRLDLWLHTAASAPHLQPVAHGTEKDLDAALAVNVRAFQRLIRCVDPLLRLAPRAADGTPGARALIAADDRVGRPFWGLYAATKTAQSALVRAWAAEVREEVAVYEVVPPAMPTALRSRFYPSQDRATLTDIDSAAARLMAMLETRPEPGLVPL
ncbi:MAG: SDR family oxidoreductase [Pseudomonadota bacterium]